MTRARRKSDKGSGTVPTAGPAEATAVDVMNPEPSSAQREPTPERDPAPSVERRESDWERVAQRAYELYQSRGGQEGRALDDWLAAERELARQQQNREDSSGE